MILKVLIRVHKFEPNYICCIDILVKPFISMIILGKENIQETLITIAK